VEDDRGVATVAGLDLEVRAGEFFGIAGVQGNGQRELVEAIAGMRAKRGGLVEIIGKDVTHASPREIIELGVGHVPEDRTKHGLVGPFTIADNLVLNQFRVSPFSHRGLRREEAIAANARTLVDGFDIRTPSPFVPVETLSGGNQQKVIIARELNGMDRLLIVAQPTRGLDVGSIEFIHRRIVEMRDQGAAVLLVSAELDEILSLSDRVGVIYRGRLVGTFDGEEATRERLGLLMATGGQHDEADEAAGVAG
jgi:simple sugar transport system ATP-binding protein